MLDLRVGYMHQIFPSSYQPTVPASAISVVDLTLSTEDGAAPFADSNWADRKRAAATASWYKAGGIGAHNVKFGYEVGAPVNKVFTGLNQGSETVALLPQGQLRLPTVNMADVRVSRPFSIRVRNRTSASQTRTGRSTHSI